MEKEFNVTGNCNPERHYMADISHKFEDVMQLIRKGKYFAINRPRQYGKTSMLSLIARKLRQRKDEFILSRMSFAGVGDTIFKDEESSSIYFVTVSSLRMHDFCNIQ